MKRILIIPTILFPLALNAMLRDNPIHIDVDGDVELDADATPEIVDNAGKASSRKEYRVSNYSVVLNNWIKDPVTRMNSVEYTVKAADTKEVLASGTAVAPFNASSLHRLNAAAQLKINFTNK